MKPEFNKNYKGMRCRVCLVREDTKGDLIPILQQTDVYELVKDELINSDREVFLSVMLTAKNHLIGVETVSIGSVNAAMLSPGEVFKGALLANAVSIILCHNHPSGDLSPSEEDIKITKRLIEVGELLGVKVLDHLIVSDQGCRTLRDHIKFPE